MTFFDYYLLMDRWEGSSHSTVDVPPKLLILMSTPWVLLVVWVVLLYTNLEYKKTYHHHKISHSHESNELKNMYWRLYMHLNHWSNKLVLQNYTQNKPTSCCPWSSQWLKGPTPPGLTTGWSSHRSSCHRHNGGPPFYSAWLQTGFLHHRELK